MKEIFPEAICKLPLADVPIPGLTAYLSQSKDHQIVFMHFSEDAEVLPHSHGDQYGLVIEGKIILTVDGKKHVYTRGDSFYILKDQIHSAKIFKGYTSMEYFADKNRYKIKE